MILYCNFALIFISSVFCLYIESIVHFIFHIKKVHTCFAAYVFSNIILFSTPVLSRELLFLSYFII